MTWDLFPKLSATYGEEFSLSGDAEQEYLEYFTEQGWELWRFPSVLGAAALKTAGFLSSLMERSVGKAAQGMMEFLSPEAFNKNMDAVPGMWVGGGPGSAGIMIGIQDPGGFFQH